MHKSFQTLFIVFSLFCFSQANAAGYAGIELGLGGGEVSSGSQVASRGYVGYLKAQEKFQYGLETGFGQEHKKHTIIKRRNLDMMGVGQYALTKKMSLIGKGGVSVVEQRIKTPSYAFYNIPEKTHKMNRIVPKAALGLGYSLSDKHSLGAIYNYSYGRGKMILDPRKPSYKLLAHDSINVSWQYHFA